MEKELLFEQKKILMFIKILVADLLIVASYALIRDGLLYPMIDLFAGNKDEVFKALIVCYIVTFLFLPLMIYVLRNDLYIQLRFTLQTKWHKHLFKYVVDFVSIVMVYLLSLALAVKLASDIFMKIEVEDSLQGYFNYAPLMSFVYVCILGPVVEELIFRGFIYRNLSKYNKIVALLISSILFAVLHQYYDIFNMPLDQFICCILPYFLLGVLFAMEYERRNSIFYSMAIHVTFNTILTILRR